MRAVFLAGLLMACAVPNARDGEGDGAGSDEALTGTTGVERGIHFEGTVIVPESASDDAIRTAIARQVKSAIGALRDPRVSLNDRAARSNLNNWTKQVANGYAKVTYKYDDRAVVTKTLSSRSTIDLTMLAGDYGAYADVLKRDCSDDATTDTDSLWYHFQPQKAACKARIREEVKAIDAERREGFIGPKEASRWFLPVTAKLDPPRAPAVAYSPEYDRLFLNRDRVTIYAFGGVDKDETDPDDVLAIEHARFLRSLLRANPNFRPVRTEPFTWLLDFYADGKKLEGVTYDQMLSWIVDKTGTLDLRKQALAKLAERWIDWDIALEINGRRTIVEVKTFFGYEDGSWEARQHAQWRYLEAFWHGDVFLYNGHSHFGHGPLEPTLYNAGNFNDRYQIMLVGSCISFNYYQKDFLELKPGGSKNLETIVNGLPSWVWGGGEVSARFITGLISGRQPTYSELLESMRIDTPWGERGYDPMRVVDGEMDNTYSRATAPIAMKVLPPVY
jgi:hypothetical protein